MNPASRLDAIRPSPIRVISEGAPADAIPLGLGEPTWELPAPARRALAAESGPCGYGPNAGLLELRSALARWHGAEAEEILVTSGSEGALFSLLMAWLEPGDEVLIPDPGFPATPPWPGWRAPRACPIRLAEATSSKRRPSRPAWTPIRRPRPPSSTTRAIPRGAARPWRRCAPWPRPAAKEGSCCSRTRSTGNSISGAALPACATRIRTESC